MGNKNLPEKEVFHIAKLAKLKLNPKELETFKKQLGEILDYFKMLNKADTSKVRPTSQVTGLINVFREDILGKSLTQKESLGGAKKKRKGYFEVKSIFD